jgi:hypothetical protein
MSPGSSPDEEHRKSIGKIHRGNLVSSIGREDNVLYKVLRAVPECFGA